MSNALNKMTAELWKLRTNSSEKKNKKKKLKSHWGNQRNELCILSTVRYFAHVNYTDRNEIYMHYCTNECIHTHKCMRMRMCACVLWVKERFYECIHIWICLNEPEWRFSKFQTIVENVFRRWYGAHYRIHCKRWI